MSEVSLFLGAVGLVLTMIAGWITNVVWTFQQGNFVDLALGIVGIFVPFIGAFHGFWLWF